MHTVIKTGPGTVELNFLWLPTVIGMNGTLKTEMEKVIKEKVLGLPMDEDGLEEVDQIVIEYLMQKFPNVKGLALYLDALKYVEL
jgi:hypothetical protein